MLDTIDIEKGLSDGEYAKAVRAECKTYADIAAVIFSKDPSSRIKIGKEQDNMIYDYDSYLDWTQSFAVLEDFVNTPWYSTEKEKFIFECYGITDPAVIALAPLKCCSCGRYWHYMFCLHIATYMLSKKQLKIPANLDQTVIKHVEEANAEMKCLKIYAGQCRLKAGKAYSNAQKKAAMKKRNASSTKKVHVFKRC